MRKKQSKLDERGSRGFGYGQLEKTDREFLKPDFDAKRQVGERYVGYYNQVTDDSYAND
jgi:hypothetical protein